MEQLTQEQAIAFYDSRAWEPMSHAERAEFQVEQDRLCMPFSVFHESIGIALGRAVFTHEFGLDRARLRVELQGKLNAINRQVRINREPT